MKALAENQVVLLGITFYSLLWGIATTKKI